MAAKRQREGRTPVKGGEKRARGNSAPSTPASGRAVRHRRASEEVVDSEETPEAEAAGAEVEAEGGEEAEAEDNAQQQRQQQRIETTNDDEEEQIVVDDEEDAVAVENSNDKTTEPVPTRTPTERPSKYAKYDDPHVRAKELLGVVGGRARHEFVRVTVKRTHVQRVWKKLNVPQREHLLDLFDSLVPLVVNYTAKGSAREEILIHCRNLRARFDSILQQLLVPMSKLSFKGPLRNAANRVDAAQVLSDSLMVVNGESRRVERLVSQEIRICEQLDLAIEDVEREIEEARLELLEAESHHQATAVQSIDKNVDDDLIRHSFAFAEETGTENAELRGIKSSLVSKLIAISSGGKSVAAKMLALQETIEHLTNSTHPASS